MGEHIENVAGNEEFKGNLTDIVKGEKGLDALKD